MEQDMTAFTISAAEFAKIYRERGQVELIDVRTPAEYREVHVEFATNVPLEQFQAAELMPSLGDVAKRPLYVVCQRGGRGQQACQALLKAGCTSAINIEGGTEACIEAGLPLVRGKSSISLERQVRIAAGSLVLLGVLLAWFVHPAFLGLSAFVGAGLVFAGATDTCGMGMLLARMPWNQCGPAATYCRGNGTHSPT
jgi:rhodanese-related sulfurtransferase